MGLFSFFSGLFGHGPDQANQAPSSLGYQEEQKAYNLGDSIEEENDASNEVSNEKPESVSEQTVSEAETTQEPTEAPKEETKSKAVVIHNLIILDESGSMSCVRHQTITGCNETLNSIRNTAKKDENAKQYVSIFCFDTARSRYIFQNEPIENTRDVTEEDYYPNAATPLYDAIGFTITRLRQVVDETDSVGMVTIITDGYENSSRRWNHRAVQGLIKNLKKKGWVFTFIGANIDVERTATGLGIESYLEFEQTDEGMEKMFSTQALSQRAYSERRRYMRGNEGFQRMALEDQQRQLGAMNHNFFVKSQRISPSAIRELKENEIFVFGSNVLGQHDGGASLYALQHFGAQFGKSEGRQGQSYAIPTDGNSIKELEAAIERFNEYVVMHPELNFMLTAIGCGNAGYSVEQIAPLFRQAYQFGNVYVPAQFLGYVTEISNL